MEFFGPHIDEATSRIKNKTLKQTNKLIKQREIWIKLNLAIDSREMQIDNKLLNIHCRHA